MTARAVARSIQVTVPRVVERAYRDHGGNYLVQLDCDHWQTGTAELRPGDAWGCVRCRIDGRAER